MFNKQSIEKILKHNKNKRRKELSNDLDNVVFLDFDGVINLDLNNFSGPFKNNNLIKNLNNFCLENNFKIVVTSSWRKYSDYRTLLYNSGLDNKIEIIGKTEVLDKDRESEVIKYIKEHCYIYKFIIIDDRPFNMLKKYQILTDTESGFNTEKYKEALELIKLNLWQ